MIVERMQDFNALPLSRKFSRVRWEALHVNHRYALTYNRADPDGSLHPVTVLLMKPKFSVYLSKLVVEENNPLAPLSLVKNQRINSDMIVDLFIVQKYSRQELKIFMDGSFVILDEMEPIIVNEAYTIGFCSTDNPIMLGERLFCTQPYMNRLRLDLKGIIL